MENRRPSHKKSRRAFPREKIVNETILFPFGKIVICSDGQIITGLTFSKRSRLKTHVWKKNKENPIFLKAKTQLSQYFAGKRKVFGLPLKLQGTDFQIKIWQEIRKIPYGQTLSYQEVAQRVGSPKAARAVGRAVGKNPICIMIPCHRVIRANGKIGGYHGGIELKKQLLALERIHHIEG
jgi:methylated-DNA-[protein]-cysteine S-methyltransferase